MNNHNTKFFLKKRSHQHGYTDRQEEPTLNKLSKRSN